MGGWMGGKAVLRTADPNQKMWFACFQAKNCKNVVVWQAIHRTSFFSLSSLALLKIEKFLGTSSFWTKNQNLDSKKLRVGCQQPNLQSEFQELFCRLGL